MKNEIIQNLENKTIAILGFGKEGKSTYNYIRKHLPNQIITILDGNEKLIENNPELNNDSNLNFVLGSSYLDNLNDYDFIIKAPGVVLKDVDISKLEHKITSQMGLVLDYTNTFMIGVTGTKGKSTTANLIYKVLKDQDQDAVLTGNMGYPILDYIDDVKKDTVFVTEFSSYQTEYIKKAPKISIIVNLFEEHLDHHGTLENYYSSKLNMFKYQTSDDYAIYFKDNETLSNYVNNNNYPGKLIKVSFEDSDKNNFYCDGKYIYNNGLKMYDLSDERNLVGMHNVNNIMFALVIVKLLKLNLPKAIKSINEFKGLKHRLECVGTYKDITFYSDTIATIPEACLSAIKSIGNIDTLIFGGMDRGIDYSDFAANLLNTSVSNFICMPDTGIKIADELKKKKTNQNVYVIEELEDAVNLAYEVTKKGACCLLSPAAPSYNKYKNFEEKGDEFVKFVKKSK